MDRNNLKYQDVISAASCGVCPPTECLALPDGTKAIRYGTSRTPTGSDFLPALMENPSRGLAEAHMRCSGYALSFFTSLDVAKLKWDKLKKTSPSFCAKRRFCFETSFDSSDGIAASVNNLGHFDFHEFKSASLETKSKLVGEFS